MPLQIRSFNATYLSGIVGKRHRLKEYSDTQRRTGNAGMIVVNYPR
jgi:hypothetical protein